MHIVVVCLNKNQRFDCTRHAPSPDHLELLSYGLLEKCYPLHMNKIQTSKTHGAFNLRCGLARQCEVLASTVRSPKQTPQQPFAPIASRTTVQQPYATARNKSRILNYQITRTHPIIYLNPSTSTTARQNVLRRFATRIARSTKLNSNRCTGKVSNPCEAVAAARNSH
jgi:hydrogenase maturation factor HypF (carbamoyltransferase family)